MMKPRQKDFILQLLNEHRVMAIATNRADGWPQTTTVAYVNDGFLLYCFVETSCQKHINIMRDPRVSIAIGSDAPKPLDIKGLSLAAKASVVTDPAEFDYIARLRLKRYPEYAAVPSSADDGPIQRIFSQPPSPGVTLLRIAPELFSVLDYSQGFGHSDLITFSERDLDVHIRSLRNRWDKVAPLSAEDVVPGPTKPSHVVLAQADVLMEVGAGSAPVQKLSPGTLVTSVRTEQDWVLIAKDGKTLGFVAAKDLLQLK